MRREHILIADDEPSIVKLLRDILHHEGWQTYTAMDGYEVLRIMEDEAPELIILDLIMPGIDGFEVCRRIRRWSQVPVIILSAKSEINSKTQCFNLGADDYVTKPFSTVELICRVKAVLRRNKQAGSITKKPYVNGDLEINFATRRVTLAGSEVRLTPIEYRLLRELVLNQGKVVSFDYLQKQTLNIESEKGTDSLYVHVARLRDKLGQSLGRFEHITTVPKVGYRFQ